MVISINRLLGVYIYIYVGIMNVKWIPVVPHQAVAEVSKIGNL